MSKAYELTGVVKIVGELQTFGSGFEKKELVVTVADGKYPQEICIEYVQGSVEKLEGVRAGDEVKCVFDLRGREHNGRYFNSLNGWKLEVLSSGAGGATEAAAEPAADVPADFDEYEDDVPF